MNKNLKCLLFSTLLIGGIATSGKVAYAWGSSEDVNVMDSHKTISVQAVQMIKNDMPNDTKVLENLKILEQNLNQYKKGAVAPDFGKTGVDKDYEMYQDHFFDPDTGKNFTYESWWYLPEKINDTAESQTRNYISQAVAKWKDGDYQAASYLLGKATHYFADVNEPHHASNLTAVNPKSAHSEFESYVDGIAKDLKINTIGQDKSEYSVNSDKNLSEFLTTQAYKYARLAKAQSTKVQKSNSWEEWRQGAEVSFKNAQKGTASVVYRFLKEVTYGGQALQTPIGKFHVVIKTANEYEAGTNDYVYFGMEFNNGKKVEYECNVPGNDFGQNTLGSYEFEIKDPTLDPNQIKKVWVRKAKYLGDDWKPQSLDLYIQGKRTVHKDINQWLSGDTTYNIEVNGLK